MLVSWDVFCMFMAPEARQLLYFVGYIYSLKTDREKADHFFPDFTSFQREGTFLYNRD